jgi:hypothetical protein
MVQATVAIKITRVSQDKGSCQHEAELRISHCIIIRSTVEMVKVALSQNVMLASNTCRAQEPWKSGIASNCRLCDSNANLAGGAVGVPPSRLPRGTFGGFSRDYSRFREIGPHNTSTPAFLTPAIRPSCTDMRRYWNCPAKSTDTLRHTQSTTRRMCIQ